MAFSNKDLQVGDLLVSEINEVYCYLGFYEGYPRSIYARPEYGYLYLFCDSWGCLTSNILHDAVVVESAKMAQAGGMLSPQASAKIVERNLSRIRSGIDGNARYSKSYGKFVRRVGHVDIPNHENLLKYAFGIVRIGDKKPRGYSFSEW